MNEPWGLDTRGPILECSRDGCAMRDPDPDTCGSRARSPARIGRLKRRADFLRVAKGRRWHGKAFSLQVSTETPASRDGHGEPTAPSPRLGFTVTKKVGGAVIRNRVRRRLREALRLTPDLPARAGHDYVIIARIEAARIPFSALRSDLARAMKGVHEDKTRDKVRRPRDVKSRP